MNEKEIYKINYVNLRTGRHETEILAGDLKFNHIDGVQRGLVVLRNPFTDEITRAYEVFSYFHKFDETGSPVQFRRQETILTEEEIRKRLEKNKGVEVLAILEPNLTVPLIEKAESNFPGTDADSTTIYVPLERHLMRQHGAFSTTKSKRTKILKKSKN
jgi:hypothetical protein